LRIESASSPKSAITPEHGADSEQRPIYTISENGRMIERYRPDDSGAKNAGVTERWNGQDWVPLKY
jgi:hypothetical protein